MAEPKKRREHKIIQINRIYCLIGRVNRRGIHIGHEQAASDKGIGKQICEICRIFQKLQSQEAERIL